MHSYESRRNPRKQTTYVGNVASIERYDKYYDFTYDLIKRGDFPIMQTTQNQGMFRKAPKASGKTSAEKTIFLGIEESRTIPPYEHSALSLTNRYSGRRLDGRPGEGGLYVASLSGVLREHAHYETRSKPPLLVQVPSKTPVSLARPGAPDQTRRFITQELAGSSVEVLFHVYAPKQVFRLADIRPQSLFAIFARHLSDPTSRKHYEISSATPIDALVSAVISPLDYSASRGMADAISDLRRGICVHGICASSARGESDTGLVTGIGGAADGSVQVLFGPPGTQLVSLDPVGSYHSFKQLAENAPNDLKKRLTTHST
jgi:hypothetical protein